MQRKSLFLDISSRFFSGAKVPFFNGIDLPLKKLKKSVFKLFLPVVF